VRLECDGTCGDRKELPQSRYAVMLPPDMFVLSRGATAMMSKPGARLCGLQLLWHMAMVGLCVHGAKGTLARVWRGVGAACINASRREVYTRAAGGPMIVLGHVDTGGGCRGAVHCACARWPWGRAGLATSAVKARRRRLRIISNHGPSVAQRCTPPPRATEVKRVDKNGSMACACCREHCTERASAVV
jgi:hypothetical protein